MRSIIFLVAFLISLTFLQRVASQSLTGIIIDASTDEKISFAHITAESGTGTVSNQTGQFELNINEADDFILISHLGFQTQKILIDNQTNLEVYLQPDVIVLDELTMVDDSYARSIAKEVMALMADCKNEYGKAFYRQISTHDTLNTSFAEGFYEVKYSCRGIELVNLKQARFAYRRSDTIPFLRFANFDYLSIGLNLYDSNKEPEPNALAKPFSQAYFHDYEFRLHNQWTANKDSLVEIQFFPGEKLRPESSLHGSFIYNRTRDQLLQQKLFINHSLGADNIELKLMDEKRNDMLDMIEPKYQWEISYKENTNVISNFRVNFFFTLSFNGTMLPCSIYSHFTIYEKMNKKPRQLEEPKVTDHYSLQNAKYKPRFWRDHPVVKRTKQEEAIIATFEKKNAFGSYFK